LQVPIGTTVYYTVDDDVAEGQELDAVVAYFQGVLDAGTARLGCGAYGSGLVLQTLRGRFGGGDFWLAGAMGWQGSHQFQNQQLWKIWQGPQLNHGGSWAGVNWLDLGFPYDPDLLAEGFVGF
jgi:hypothetical protein